MIFNPTIFLGKIIIIVEANNPLLEGFSNNFIKITEATRVRAIAQVEEYVALADGTRVQAVEIVIVTENWLQKNFLTPIESEKWRLQAGVIFFFLLFFILVSQKKTIKIIKNKE